VKIEIPLKPPFYLLRNARLVTLGKSRGPKKSSKEKLELATSKINIDGLVKSRHSRPGGNPESAMLLKKL
jgi:hypothetical protein